MISRHGIVEDLAQARRELAAMRRKRKGFVAWECACLDLIFRFRAEANSEPLMAHLKDALGQAGEKRRLCTSKLAEMGRRISALEAVAWVDLAPRLAGTQEC